MNIPKFVKEYQCSGCVVDEGNCYEKNDIGISCKKHVIGTMGFPYVGKFLLWCPIGFNRIGEGLDFYVFKTYKQFKKEWGEFDKFNVPVWKYVNENNHTFVRGLSPRINRSFLIIILEDCIGKINCLEITEKDIEEMD